jgi:hypothetical protein
MRRVWSKKTVWSLLLVPLALVLVLTARGGDVDTVSANHAGPGNPAPNASSITVGTVLTMDPGVGFPNIGVVPPGPGTWFRMSVFPPPTAPFWTPFGGGTDDGIIVGKNQTSGGQDAIGGGALTTSGELSTAWFFFGNYGTFATTTFSGAVGGVVTTDASANLFDSASCTGGGCVGKTTLGTWNVGWNGVAVPMGSALGCNSTNCTPSQLAGENVFVWEVNGVGCDAGSNCYLLRYSQVVPNGDPSGFGNVPYGHHIEGEIILPAAATATPTPPPAATATPTATPPPAGTPTATTVPPTPTATVVTTPTATVVTTPAATATPEPTATPTSAPITLPDTGSGSPTGGGGQIPIWGYILGVVALLSAGGATWMRRRRQRA